MSMAACENCSRYVDTDLDPDSLEIRNWQCLCQLCRREYNFVPVGAEPSNVVDFVTWRKDHAA